MSLRVATILARSGSSGLKNKNIRPFMGQPLLVRTVRQAIESEIFDCVVVSSDSLDDLKLAEDAGAEVLVNRPPCLAVNDVTKIPGIRHAVEVAELESERKFDIVVDLAVTSPLRAVEDIKAAVSVLESGASTLVLSGNEAKDNPYFNLIEQNDCGSWVLSKDCEGRFNARQSAPAVVALKGAVAGWTRTEIAKSDDDRVIRPGLEVIVMPGLRGLDIDDESDFMVAELLAKTGEVR